MPQFAAKVGAEARGARRGPWAPRVSAPLLDIVWTGAAETDPRTARTRAARAPSGAATWRRWSATPCWSCPPSTTSSPSSASSAARAPRWAAPVLTFGALFGQIATVAGRPPGAVLSPAAAPPLRRGRGRGPLAAARAAAPLRRAPRLRRRLRAAARRAAGGRGRPARRRGAAPGPWRARLPRRRRRALRRLRGGSASAAGRLDPAGIAREATAAPARATPAPGRGRPVFLYGLDDLTPAQFDLVGALDRATPRSPSRCRSSPATRRSPRAPTCWGR